MIYSLEKVAELEGTTTGSLRVMLFNLKAKNKPLEWRCWRFYKLGTAWLATGIDDDLEICA